MAFTAIKSLKLPETVISCGTSAFQNNVELEEFVMSPNMKTIPNGLLYNCPSLKCFIVPEGVESLGYFVTAFANNLKLISLPSTLAKLSSSKSGASFLNLPTSTEIYSFNNTGPIANYETFNGQTLHVPAQSTENYRYQTTWSKCQIIDDLVQKIEIRPYANSILIVPDLEQTPYEELNVATFAVDVKLAEPSSFEDDSETVFSHIINMSESDDLLYSKGLTESSSSDLMIPELLPNTAYTVHIKGYSSPGHLILDRTMKISTTDDTVTEVEGHPADDSEVTYYDLFGISIKNPSNGIFIVNGKKVHLNNNPDYRTYTTLK